MLIHCLYWSTHGNTCPDVVVACCRLAEGTRKAVEGWGLKLLCKEKRWNSDSLTVIETPEVGLTCNLP